MVLTVKTSSIPTIERSELIHLPYLERLSTDDVALLAFSETPSLQRLRIDFGFVTFLDDGSLPSLVDAATNSILLSYMVAS